MNAPLVVSEAEPHKPVLLSEVLEWLRVKADGTYIDATLGAGGHSRAIAERLTTGRLIGLDRDARAIELARERMRNVGNLSPVALFYGLCRRPAKSDPGGQKPFGRKRNAPRAAPCDPSGWLSCGLG